MTADPLAAAVSGAPVAAKAAFNGRALEPSAAFWFTMLMASALGTNVGDFWAVTLGLGLGASFATLGVLSALFIWGDRGAGASTEAFYWFAIVFLRAVATNVGDLLTHVFGVNYVLATVLLGAATLVAGNFTVPSLSGAAPRIDFKYWLAMFIGGVFGTIGGDLASHNFGLFLAAVLLVVILIVTIRARRLIAPTAMVGYWCIVLAERAAGTPLGDWIASGHGLGLGLIVSIAITAALVLLGLRARGGRPSWGAASGISVAAPASFIVLPLLRIALFVLSIIGCMFMLGIFFAEHPRDPSFVLSYAAGLALNAIYLGWQEIAGLSSSRLARLLTLWFAAKRQEFDRWAAAKERELRERAKASEPSPPSRADQGAATAESEPHPEPGLEAP